MTRVCALASVLVLLTVLTLACGGKEPVPTKVPASAATVAPGGTTASSQTPAAVTKSATTTASGTTPAVAPTVALIPAPTPVPPSASFSVDVESGNAPLTVEFNSSSLGPITSIEWDFGDETSSTDQSPTHRYTIAGTYNVELTVSGPGGADTSVRSGMITIDPGPPVSLEISPATATLAVQEGTQFTAVARDEFGNVVPSTFGWTVDGEGGSITENGIFTAGTKADSYTDTVQASLQPDAGGFVGSASVTVEPGPLSKVVVEPTEVTLNVGAAQSFSFKAFDAFDNETTNVIATWTVPPDAGAIDANGMLTAGTKAGPFFSAVRLEAVDGPIRASASADLVVRPGPLATVEVEPSFIVVEEGTAQQFQAAGLDQYGNVISGLAFLWEATGGQIGQTGYFTADQSGRSEVRASAGLGGTAVAGLAGVVTDGIYGGTLTMAMVADGGTLDPATTGTVNTTAITQATYDNLLMIQPDLSVKPELATSWDASDDLSSYTFHLREGVKFHHGKEFKAEDVVFTFERLLDPVLNSPARNTLETIQNIIALDDYTVRFDLDGPNSFFPSYMSINQARITPADVDVSRLATEEFGTGPFVLTGHLPGLRTVMARNPDYWEEGKPYLDEIVILNIAQAATRVTALRDGEVDIVHDLEPQSVASIESHPDTTVLKTASLSNIGMDMDIRVPPFNDKLVRQAMQAATDREFLRQAAMLGLGETAYDHPIPPNDPRFALQHKPPDYDPDLARSLLEQAGYPDGIDVTLNTADVGAGMTEMAAAFKESAAPAGIRVDVQQRSSNGYWSDVWMVEPFTMVYWNGRANPDESLTVQYHSDSVWNAPRYFNDELDALIERARRQSLDDQKVTYAEVQRILIDDVPRLVVAYRPSLYGARKDVRDLAPHPPGWALIQDAWLER